MSFKFTKKDVLVAGFHIVHHASGSGYDGLASHLPATYTDADDLIFGHTRFGSLQRKINMLYFDFYLKLIGSKYKIVHFLYPEFHLGFTLASLHHIKKIATMHLKLDWMHKRRLAEFDSFKDYIYAKIKYRAFSQLDGIITLSNANVHEAQICFPNAKVKFIPHGIHDNSHHFRLFDNKANPFKIITIGRTYRDFEQYKTIVDYARQYEKNWEFHLVGAWSSWRNFFKDYPNVVVYAYLENDVYFSLLNSCHVHLLPLTFATANNALLEAHSLGVPSIITNLLSVKDYATSDSRFFSDLPEAIHHLQSYQKMDKQTFNEIREQIKGEAQRFFWENIAQEVMHFYHEIYENGNTTNRIPEP
jgi:glycosyltransferase involved in cell wall biosynthesis